MSQGIKTAVTCSDLIAEGQWLEKLCCPKCHKRAGEGNKNLISDDDGNDRSAALCCLASHLLHGYPSHDMEMPGYPVEGKGVSYVEDCMGEHHVEMRELSGCGDLNWIDFTCGSKEDAETLCAVLSKITKMIVN